MSTRESFEVEFTYYVTMFGTKADAQAVVDKVDDAFYESLDIHCGSVECCPGPRGLTHVDGAVGSSTINRAGAL